MRCIIKTHFEFIIKIKLKNNNGLKIKWRHVHCIPSINSKQFNQPVVSNPRFDPRSSNVLPGFLGISYLVCPRIIHNIFSITR